MTHDELIARLDASCDVREAAKLRNDAAAALREADNFRTHATSAGKAWRSLYEETVRERDELRAELAGCRADAERYRWLRLQNGITGSKAGIWLEGDVMDRDAANPYPPADEADAAIDAALGKP